MKTYKLVNQVIAPPYELPANTKQLVLLNSFSAIPIASYNANNPYDPASVASSSYTLDRLYNKLNIGKYYLVKKATYAHNNRLWENDFASAYVSENEVLIVLEDFQSDYDFKTEKILKHQLDALGKDYYIDAYESMRNYRVKAYWSMYNGQNGELLEQFEDVGMKKFFTQGLKKDQTIAKLDSLGKGIPHYIMDSLAQSLTDYIMPIKIYDSWTYFSKGSPALESGSKYFDLHKLSEAENIFRNALSSADEKTKPKLHYNLAVLADIRRDYDDALREAENAVLLSNKSIYSYLLNKIRLKHDIETR